MFRKILTTTILLMLIVIVSLGAFTNTSFRNASTATLLEDDYDLWLGPYPLPDPARLPLVEGARLYTNLSNLVDKTEGQFSGITNDFFLIGGSTTPLFNIGHLGIVIDRYNYKEGLNTGLLDMNNLPIFGFGDVAYTEFVDDDNNGTYDRRTEVEQTGETWTDTGMKDFVLCFGKEMDDKLLGLFYQLNITNTEDFGSPGGTPVNFTFDSTDFNINSGMRTYTENGVGTGDTKDDLTEHLFGFSFWKYMGEKKAFGIHFGYGLYSEKYNDIWDASEDWDGSPDDPGITDTYNMNETNEINVPVKGNAITGWLSYINDWNSITHLRFDTYYIKRSFDVESGATIDYTLSNSRIAADNHTESENGSETSIITGDGSGQSLGLMGKVIYDLTDRVKFAFGFNFHSGNNDTTSVEDQDANYVYIYDDGDNQPNDPDDYTETITYSNTIQTKVTEGTNRFSIPVCVEFNVKEPLVFRLGAIHTVDLIESTTNIDLIDASPGLVHRVQGDGTITDLFIDNPNTQNIGSSEDLSDSESETMFTYGVGYTVSKNLQIDFMGFTDLTNLSNLKLSATMKF